MRPTKRQAHLKRARSVSSVHSNVSDDNSVQEPVEITGSPSDPCAIPLDAVDARIPCGVRESRPRNRDILDSPSKRTRARRALALQSRGDRQREQLRTRNDDEDNEGISSEGSACVYGERDVTEPRARRCLDQASAGTTIADDAGGTPTPGSSTNITPKRRLSGPDKESSAYKRTKLVIGEDFYVRRTAGTKCDSAVVSINELKRVVNKGVCEICHEPMQLYVLEHKVLEFDYKVGCITCDSDTDFEIVHEEVILPYKFRHKRTAAKKERAKKYYVKLEGAVYGNMSEGGASHMQLNGILVRMGLPTLSTYTFHKYKNFITSVAQDVCIEHLRENRDKIVQAYAEDGIFPDANGILNVNVIYDGTWHTRGFTSVLGAGLVIDVKTGCVLDYVTFSKGCSTCTRMKNKLNTKKITLEHYAEWLKKHEDEEKCFKNYEGSSGAMESRAALVIWQRSIEKNKMRYVTMISDGDSNTFRTLEENNIYEGITLVKHDCINHVSKRLTTYMTKLREQTIEKMPETVKGKSGKGGKTKGKSSAQPIIVKMSGKNRLTENIVKHMQKYYRKAIIAGKTIQEMKKGIEASWQHFTILQALMNILSIIYVI